MMGLDSLSSRVALIDYGLARSYCNPHNGEHIEFSDEKEFTGTARYASLNALRGSEQSRRDDMEAIAYVLVFLMRGFLPWEGVRARDEADNAEKMLAAKEAISVEQLCEGLPEEFSRYLEHTRGLAFDETPPYAEYRRWFRELLIREGFIYDCLFEWPMKSRKASTASFCCPAMGSQMFRSAPILDDPPGLGRNAVRGSLPPRRLVFSSFRVTGNAPVGRAALPPLRPPM
jgi:serine/threonine protein kinase